MNKKKIIIIVIYIISLLIFSFIAELNTNKFMNWDMETMDYGNILVTLAPSLMAEFLHIIMTTIFSYDKNVKSSNNKGFLLQTI